MIISYIRVVKAVTSEDRLVNLFSETHIRLDLFHHRTYFLAWVYLIWNILLPGFSRTCRIRSSLCFYVHSMKRSWFRLGFLYCSCGHTNTLRSSQYHHGGTSVEIPYFLNSKDAATTLAMFRKFKDMAENQRSHLTVLKHQQPGFV